MAAGAGLGLSAAQSPRMTVGTQKQRGFINDNVLNTPEQGDIHFSSYIPDSYDGSGPLKETYKKLCALYKAEGVTKTEINELVTLDVKDQKYFTDRGYADQHMGGQAFAKDKKIMGWLFGRHQAKDSVREESQ